MSSISSPANRIPCFFVQNNWVQKITIPVARFARSSGIALEDRSSIATFDPDMCGIDWTAYHPVLPYGSVQFIKSLKRSPALAKYLCHVEANFGANLWRNKLGLAMLNAGGKLVLVRDAAAVLDSMEGGCAHIRPNVEDKAFIAKVFTAASWAAMLVDRPLPADLTCWLSPVQGIHREWRCWLVGGRLIETSQYRAGDKMELVNGGSSELDAFVASIASKWLPAPCVVLDVAQTSAGFKVLEFNSMHSSGWYAADVPKVLQAWHDWACARTYVEPLPVTPKIEP